MDSENFRKSLNTVRERPNVGCSMFAYCSRANFYKDPRRVIPVPIKSAAAGRLMGGEVNLRLLPSPTRRKRSINRGSLRTLSKSGSILSQVIISQRAAYAFSKQMKVWSVSPRAR